MITAIALSPYRLPLRRPWCSARGAVGERLGWLVGCEADGLVGYGDCAPLPAAGTEDRAAAWGWLSAWRETALGRTPCAALMELEGTDGDGKGGAAPAARYAAECALADLAAQAAGVPLARWLAPGTELDAQPSVPVNAALGPLAEVTGAGLADCATEGYLVFKVKVGLAGLRSELRQIEDLASSLPPGGRLRLDANGAWTLAEAQRAVAALNALPIEALEEPLGDPAPANLGALQGLAGFPLALDESLTRPGTVWDLHDLPVRRLVLKPAGLGGLRRTLALAGTAARAGIEVVVTSLIESAAGLWPTVQLAAAIGSPIPQGLATAAWLARDLGGPPRPRAGRLEIPRVPGGGFRPY